MRGEAVLGKYKLNEIYNEDSYKAIKDIPDKSVDCIYTDIPYLIESGGGGSSDLAKRINKINYTDILNIRNGIDYSIFEDFYRVMKKVNIFIWCSKMQLQDIINWWLGKENVNFEILVWCKSNPTPATNNVWLPDIEYCLYFREKGVSLNNGYDLKSKWYLSPINKSDKDQYDHPTIKPLELVKRHLLHTTQEGDIVFDPFLGSGTTCVAAKELGRKYLGFEINEKYYKIAKDRLDGLNQIERKQIDKGQITLF